MREGAVVVTEKGASDLLDLGSELAGFDESTIDLVLTRQSDSFESVT